MAWAFVQKKTQRVASGANAVVFTSNVTAGSLIEIDVGLATYTATISSVVSSTGDTTTPIGSLQSLVGCGACQKYYIKNATAGATTITITPSAGASHCVIKEYSGLDTTAPFDVQAGANGTGTAISSGAATTTAANELLACFIVSNRATVAGSGFTDRENTSFDIFIESEDKSTGSAGSYSGDATYDGTGSWIAIMATFKIPAGGAPAPHNLALLGVGQ